MEAEVFTISEFCERNKISRTKFFGLKSAGRGPREMMLGGSVRISREAEIDWRRLMEQPDANEQARAVARREQMRRVGKLAAQSPHHVSKRGRT